jgi:hypothetical protein
VPARIFRPDQSACRRETSTAKQRVRPDDTIDALRRVSTARPRITIILFHRRTPAS